MSRIAWLASVLLELLTACGTRAAEVPASWDVEEIRDRVVSTEGHGFTDLEMPRFRSADVEILGFLSAEENRGVDLCLVKLEGVTVEGEPHWMLATLCRRPFESRPSWRIPWESHSSKRYSVHLEEPPTEGQVSSFVGQLERVESDGYPCFDGYPSSYLF